MSNAIHSTLNPCIVHAYSFLVSLFSTDLPGGWTEWAEDGGCTVTCGAGVVQETRSCTNPRPGPLGDNCVDDGDGSVKDSATACNPGPCPGKICFQICVFLCGRLIHLKSG